ncbi:Serine/threonine-protein kinase 32A [Durusdinium trenchii]|uniref:Serine/threonine-protein kinase 32A n=1 Tax=Durusdinium trenchii TaxID=1381693 RepID=A0ABP0ISJ9_9DINO
MPTMSATPNVVMSATPDVVKDRKGGGISERLMNYVYAFVWRSNLDADVDLTRALGSLAVMMPPKGKLHGVFGTAPYMAPEMLRNEGYDFLADVWSIGSVAYLLVFGSFPYSPGEANAPAMKKAIIEARETAKEV